MKITKNVDRNIFRGYDIRGVYPENLTEDVAYTVGKAFGTHILNIGKKKCVVGHDNRISSESLTEALLKGILETGVDVTYLGLVTTPMYYYASILLQIPSGVMVTASHNPKDDNGFKFAFDESGNAKGKEIQDFYEEVISGNFKDGKGTLSQYNIKNEYIELMQNSLSFGKKKIKVILDPGNGTTSIIAKEIYSKFPLDIKVINGKSDGTFPHHHPDPCVEENLEQLKKAVLKEKADIGIAFDGDGDRLGVVDEKGRYIPTDQYMIIIIRDLINKVDKKEFLYDVKCSKALEDEIEVLGAKGICYRTGNSYTKAACKEYDVPFGGEYSGHVYFRDKFPGFDSGLYAGLRILEILSNTNKKTSELLKNAPKYYSTPELKFSSPDDKKNAVIEKVKEYCENQKYKILTIDGVKVLFDDGFALIRVSNTGPNITARFEAKNKERLSEIENEFTNLIHLYN